MTTHPGSADALRKALKECRTNIAGYNIRTSDDYRTLMVDFFNEMQRIHAVACAALSADAALSQQVMVDDAKQRSAERGIPVFSRVAKTQAEIEYFFDPDGDGDD